MGKEIQLHLHLYKLLIGEIRTGHILDHLCRIRMCVNPFYTEPVTHQVNTLRGDAILFRGSTHDEKRIQGGPSVGPKGS